MSPVDPDDWRRLDQERYLKERSFRWASYRPYRDGWDHDHCEFCNLTFSVYEGDLHEGYVTTDDIHWVCAECFADFKEEMEWNVVK